MILLSAATKCSPLVPAENQTITDLEVYVGESTQVSCDPGYKLDVGSLVKDIHCVNGSSTPEWNDTVGECIRKCFRLAVRWFKGTNMVGNECI